MKIKAIESETGREIEIDLEELNLENGASKRKKLPAGLVKRVRRFKGLLKEVDMTPIDETIESFRKDLHPEREIAIWEKIAFSFDAFVEKKKIKDLKTKEDVFRIMLFRSLGSEDYRDSIGMTSEEIDEVVEFYHNSTQI